MFILSADFDLLHGEALDASPELIVGHRRQSCLLHRGHRFTFFFAMYSAV